MRRRWKYSLGLAVAYFAVAFVLVQLVGHFAYFRAETKAALLNWELWKDSGVVAVSTVVLWLGAFLALGRAERTASELADLKGALVLAERRAYTGVMAALFAHDSNNVLMAATFDLGELKPPPSADAERLAGWKRVHDGIDRLITHNRRLLKNARAAAAEGAEPLDLRVIVDECVAVLKTHRLLRTRALHVRGPESLPAEASAPLVQQLVANLILHSASRAPPARTLEVHLRSDIQEAVLEVHSDSGAATEAEKGSVTDALRTAEDDGAALALVGARATAEAQGGRLDVEASPLGGTCYRVTLPRKRSTTPREVAAHAAPRPAP